MKHIVQPSKKSCGQTSLAMITGHSVHDIIKVLPDNKGLHAWQLIKYLRKHGYTTSDRPIRVREEDQNKMIWSHPGTVIVKVIWQEKNYHGHFMVYHDFKMYDPLGWPSTWAADGGRIVSIIYVERKEQDEDPSRS